jgi:tRNA-dihydrouridine synthase
MHYRTVAEGYGPAPGGLERLARAREYLASLPLLGSGDLHSVEAAGRMYDVASVDGVTPARGLLANPWLLRDIESACRATAARQVSDADRRDFLRRLIGEAHRTGSWRRGFVLEVARHLFGRSHPAFDRLLAADCAAAMLSALSAAS